MQYFQYNLLIQEELWAAIEAEVLDATGEVDISGEDAEALNSAYVAKVDDYLMWQWLNILAPCGVPVCCGITVNQALGNTLAKCLGIHKYHIPFILVDDIAVLIEQFNLADA